MAIGKTFDILPWWCTRDKSGEWSPHIPLRKSHSMHHALVPQFEPPSKLDDRSDCAPPASCVLEDLFAACPEQTEDQAHL